MRVKSRERVIRKFLVEWSLHLGSEELTKISSQPAALEKALRYVHSLAEESELEIYRIVSMEELTRHTPSKMSRASNSMHSSGIAILRADSLEEARKVIEEWMEGLSYGMISIGAYVEYEIKPLVDIVRGGME